MGREYVARVCVLMPGELDPRFKDMPTRSAIVLLVMAGTCLDEDGKTAPAGHYFRGWHVLANAMGFPNANDDTAGQRAVSRALLDLRKRGIAHKVGSTEERRPTARRVYAIDL